MPEVTLTYTYDGVGNTTSLSDSLGGAISYTYDARNMLASEAQTGSGEAQELIDFIYDNAGNMMSLTRFSDTGGMDEVLATTYSYDNANNLTGITDKLPGGTVVSSYAYTLDPADRVTAETKVWTNADDTTSSDTTGYTYTNNNQLTEVTHTDTALSGPETFTYDANGNRDDGRGIRRIRATSCTATAPLRLHVRRRRQHDQPDGHCLQATRRFILMTTATAWWRFSRWSAWMNRCWPSTRMMRLNRRIGVSEEGCDDLDAVRRYEHGPADRLQWLGGRGGAVRERAEPGGSGCGAGAGYAHGWSGVVPGGSVGVGGGYREQFGDGD